MKKMSDNNKDSIRIVLEIISYLVIFAIIISIIFNVCEALILGLFYFVLFDNPLSDALMRFAWNPMPYIKAAAAIVSIVLLLIWILRKKN